MKPGTDIDKPDLESTLGFRFRRELNMTGSIDIIVDKNSPSCLNEFVGYADVDTGRKQPPWGPSDP
jgi:hypothetical protein